MQNKELMFDTDSFNDLKTSDEAQSAYNYFAHNVTTFRRELAEANVSYSEAEKTVRQCWVNLIQSCKKAGYMNGHMSRLAKLYKVNV